MKLKIEDYVEVVEVIEDPEDKIDITPVRNSKHPLAELNAIWQKVVGENIGNVSRVVGIYGYRLTVEVSHPVYANELKLYMDLILEKIRVELEKLDPPLKLNLCNDILFRFNPNLGNLYLEEGY